MKNFISILFILFAAHWTIAQCTVNITTPTTTVDCGDCFTLTAVGVAQDTLLSENFNNNQLGAGWAANQVPMFNNPCGAPPNNSATCWFGSQQTQPRYVETIDYDVSCGGDLCWLMKYAVQGGTNNNCEGPDLPNEGVKLQYSLDGGATWVLIADHPPLNGGYNSFQTNWNNYCETIPVAAQTTSTRFRWYQAAGSNANFDHWGIDDVYVTAANCQTYFYDWLVDGTPNSDDSLFCQSIAMDSYDVIYTNGIDDTCAASITIDASLNPSFTYFAPCAGEEVTFTNTSIAPYTTAKWVFLNGQDTIISPNATYTFPPGSNMDVELIIIDAAGCSGSVTNTVVEIPELTVNVVNEVDVTCNSGDDGIVTVDVSQGTTPYSFSWTGSSSVTETADDLSQGTTTVTVTDANGCVRTVDATIDEPDPLVITDISLDTIICIDDPVTLFGQGGGGSSPYTYTWIENNQTVATGSNVTVTPSGPNTEYCLVLGEQCGSPQDTACMVVNYPAELDPTLMPNIAGGCFPVEIEFTNTTNTTEVVDYTIWSYSDGGIDTTGGLNSTTHEFGLGTWDVSMEVVSNRGCRYYKTYTDLVEGYPYPEANFYVSPNPVSFYESKVGAYSQSDGDIVSYSWIAEGAEPSYSSVQNPKFEYPKEIANYPLILVVENSYGCTDTLEKLVRVENVVTIFAPNTFTPDGDGENDTWRVNILGIDTQNFHLQIYNRWGEKVFESFDPDGEWDGTYGGKIVKDGTYMWTIKAFNFDDDNKHEFKGAINILK